MFAFLVDADMVAFVHGVSCVLKGGRWMDVVVKWDGGYEFVQDFHFGRIGDDGDDGDDEDGVITRIHLPCSAKTVMMQCQWWEIRDKLSCE